ncbi:MAG: hypothetical protein ACE5H9_17330 [Anaerolineae bacterium]
MSKNLSSRRETYETAIILAIGVLLAGLLRFSLREFRSGDYWSFTSHWYAFVNQQGGFAALAHDFTNYSPFYSYFLVIAAALFSGLSDVFAIKLISIVFDFVCAGFVYKIVRLKYPVGVLPVFGFLTVLFAPTVFLNSSLWGQTDVIYTTGLVACLYFLLVKKEIPAFIAFGLAVSFKMQAIFLGPLLLILLLKRRVSWKSFALVPFTYLAVMLPAWLAGRPLNELLFVYLNQANFYRDLTKNAPNLYQWIPNDLYDIFYPAGLIWTLSIVFLLALGVYKSRAAISPAIMVQLATVSVVLMPYFLPKMHERYFFAADVLSIVFAFYYPRYFFIPLVVGGVSLFSYFPFLFGQEVIPLSSLALILAVTIVFLVRHLAHALDRTDLYPESVLSLAQTPSEEIVPQQQSGARGISLRSRDN